MGKKKIASSEHQKKFNWYFSIKMCDKVWLIYFSATILYFQTVKSFPTRDPGSRGIIYETLVEKENCRQWKQIESTKRDLVERRFWSRRRTFEYLAHAVSFGHFQQLNFPCLILSFKVKNIYTHFSLMFQNHSTAFQPTTEAIRFWMMKNFVEAFLRKEVDPVNQVSSTEYFI